MPYCWGALFCSLVNSLWKEGSMVILMSGRMTFSECPLWTATWTSCLDCRPCLPPSCLELAREWIWEISISVCVLAAQKMGLFEIKLQRKPNWVVEERHKKETWLFPEKSEWAVFVPAVLTAVKGRAGWRTVVLAVVMVGEFPHQKNLLQIVFLLSKE